MAKRVIDWSYVVSNTRVGPVKVSASETPSGTEYVIYPTGSWVRQDDLNAVLGKRVQVCCGKYIQVIFPSAYPQGPKPEPIIEDDTAELDDTIAAGESITNTSDTSNDMNIRKKKESRRES